MNVFQRQKLKKKRVVNLRVSVTLLHARFPTTAHLHLQMHKVGTRQSHIPNEMLKVNSGLGVITLIIKKKQ